MNEETEQWEDEGGNIILDLDPHLEKIKHFSRAKGHVRAVEPHFVPFAALGLRVVYFNDKTRAAQFTTQSGGPPYKDKLKFSLVHGSGSHWFRRFDRVIANASALRIGDKGPQIEKALRLLAAA